MSEPSAEAWTVSEEELREDPLLDCLVAVTRMHGEAWTADALSAGLPLVENRLTPSLLPRAAERANLSARLLRRPLQAIPDATLPAILLLRDNRACVLMERLPEGRYRVQFPEFGESSSVLDESELADLYGGVVCLLRPRFRFEARAPRIHQPERGHWFWSAMRANWRLYRDALVAAMVINLFSLAVPMYSMNVYDRVVPNRAEETLWVLAVGTLVVLGFDFLLRTLRALIVDTASKRVDISLSSAIMARVLGLRMEAKPVSVGSFAANLRAFEGVRDFIASSTVVALVDLPFVVIFFVVLAWISPWLLFPPAIGILAVLLVSLAVQGRIRSLTEETYRATAQRNATLVESLTGLETIKVLNAEGAIQRSWERATLYLAQIGARLRLLSSTAIHFAQFAQQAVSVTVVVIGVYLLGDAQMTLGGIIASSILASRAMAPMGQIAGLLTQYHNARTGLHAIEEQMKLPVERPDEAPFVHRKAILGAITFRNVTFAYPGAETPALSGVSFHIEPGERVGIIGHIGSGKTTIEKLILGLYSPTEGAVLIDGVDLHQIDPAELRRSIGYVPQDVTLFYGSLKENIAKGAPYADDQAVLRAAEQSGVSTFANLHPSGFDMLIGERGESLSGGQRQAVAVARALLGEPPILLLDEPSSSMDSQSEERLKQQLRAYPRNRTLLLISHRVSLLELVDRLIVLDQGRIVADGPKAEVIEALQQGRIRRAE
ncbi:MAG: type I secretion system permease/ATPase [Gammaproteobacteria bacterium]